MSASDSCEPNAGMERPSAPVGGLIPSRMTWTTLSDADINALVKFLRARFSTQPPWKT